MEYSSAPSRSDHLTSMLSALIETREIHADVDCESAVVGGGSPADFSGSIDVASSLDGASSLDVGLAVVVETDGAVSSSGDAAVLDSAAVDSEAPLDDPAVQPARRTTMHNQYRRVVATAQA